jgi:hypothetical protein
MPYIKTNNPISAYALHILINRHEHGSPEHTTQLLKACVKGKVMNCWESFCVEVLQQHNLLIDGQKTSEPNPLYALGNVTKHVTQLNTHSDSVYTGPTQRQHQHTGESIIKQITILDISTINIYTSINKVHIYNRLYIRPPYRTSWELWQQNDFSHFIIKWDNFNILKILNMEIQ